VRVSYGTFFIPPLPFVAALRAIKGIIIFGVL